MRDVNMIEPVTSSASPSQRQVSHLVARDNAELRAAIQAAITLLTPQFGSLSKRAIAEATALLQRVLL